MSGRPGGSGGRRREEEHEEAEHENGERWLLSYADMITLLMALFIVLFAISQVDQAKLIALSNGLEQYFGEPAAVSASTGILNGGVQGQPDSKAIGPTRPESIVPVLVQPTSQGNPTEAGKGAGTSNGGLGAGKGPGTGKSQKDDLTAIRDKIAKSLAAKGLSGSVQFQVRDHGLVVNVVTDRVLFNAGEASLRPEGRKVLDAVAPILKTLPNELTVEGHTDNVPITGTFPSNWELSTERATTVLRYMLSRGVNGSRVSAAGYADQRPLSTNATVDGRARNRRVAIVVHALADSAFDDAAKTGSSSGSSSTSTTSNSASSIPSLPGD